MPLVFRACIRLYSSGRHYYHRSCCYALKQNSHKYPFSTTFTNFSTMNTYTSSYQYTYIQLLPNLNISFSRIYVETVWFSFFFIATIKRFFAAASLRLSLVPNISKSIESRDSTPLRSFSSTRLLLTAITIYLSRFSRWKRFNWTSSAPRPSLASHPRCSTLQRIMLDRPRFSTNALSHSTNNNPQQCLLRCSPLFLLQINTATTPPSDYPLVAADGNRKFNYHPRKRAFSTNIGSFTRFVTSRWPC